MIHFKVIGINSITRTRKKAETNYISNNSTLFFACLFIFSFKVPLMCF